MAVVDDQREHLIYQVFREAGVLPTHGDAKALREDVIQEYFHQLFETLQLSSPALFLALAATVMAHRHRCWQEHREEALVLDRQLVVRDACLEVSPIHGVTLLI